MTLAIASLAPRWVLADAPSANQPAPPAPPADPPPPPAPESPAPTDATAIEEFDPEAAESEGEVITVKGRAPVSQGAVRIDATEARRAPGALGEPLRAIALLPGVATSTAALSYPVIRGSMPGESRFSFDGIELPMLYHLLIGNQVVHPGFLGDLELSAGGYGVEHGRVLGGLVALDAPDEPEGTRTELRSTIIEAGVLHARRLSKRTSLMAAFRAGTLGAAVKLIDSKSNLNYIDQQLRLVHRLASGDRLVLTSIGAFDYTHTPPEEKVYLGFHRLDARWERKRAGLRIRAGLQTELDILGSRGSGEDIDGDGAPDTSSDFSGNYAAGVRPYAELAVDPASWLTLRGGVDARFRKLRTSGEDMFDPERGHLASASSTDAAGAWLAADVRRGRVTVTPGVRADTYHADHPMSDRRHATIDPRLAVTVQLTNNLRAEASGGLYSAPPQATLAFGSLVLGPLPSTDGVGAPAGMSRAKQAQAGVRAQLPGGFDASLFGYRRDTRYAIDFSMLDKDFSEADRMPCQLSDAMPRFLDSNVDTRAVGVEAMVRRDLSRRLSGWVSYSLGKIDRKLPMGRFPHDFDQRHTLNAALQLKAGKWLLGAGLHIHTGRPAPYPIVSQCGEDPSAVDTDVIYDPTHLRRLPTTWRLDFRAERAFRFKSWSGRLVIEMQNATLQKEYFGFNVDDENRVVPLSFRLPLPMIGFEADF